MRKNKKSFFTLLEVLVSMGVFSLLMLALMQFFSAAQGVWERTGNKAELFESAKTTMDIIANDLACAYYEMDHDSNYQFFSISSSDTTQVVFAAQKESGNAQLCYKWDSATWKLYRYEKTEASVFPSGTATPPGNWFTRSGKTGWINEMTSGVVAESNLLEENVLDFSVTARKKNALNTPISVSASASDKFPDVVIISMTMLSNDAHEKLLNRLSSDAKIREYFEGDATGSKFKYTKADGTESGDEKSINEIIREGGSLAENDDSTQMILFKGCQQFTRAVSLVDRVNSLN